MTWLFRPVMLCWRLLLVFPPQSWVHPIYNYQALGHCCKANLIYTSFLQHRKRSSHLVNADMLLLLLQPTCFKVGCVHICKYILLQCSARLVHIPDMLHHQLWFQKTFFLTALLLWSSPLALSRHSATLWWIPRSVSPRMQTVTMLAAWKEDGRREGRKGEGEGVRKKNEKGGGGAADVAVAVGRGVSYLARAALPKHPWVAVLGATTTPRAV